LYPVSVRNAFSIRWYHEIIRKYAEGVRGLKPKVERKRNPGYEIQGRSALRAADVNRPLHERWAGRALLQDSRAQRLQPLSITRRSSEYALGGIQTPAAPSERPPTLITTQGSASAPPWAFDVRYAFGVFSDAPPNNDSTVIRRFLTPNTYRRLRLPGRCQQRPGYGGAPALLFGSP